VRTNRYGRNPEERLPRPQNVPPVRRQDASLTVVPPEWRLEPSDPTWKGYRYISPTGDATAIFYSTPVDQEPTDEHWKAFAFRTDEGLTDLTRRRDWGEVAGLTGDRGFYRKAAIDCHERVWRHVELEFPAGAKSSLSPFIERAAHTLDLSSTNTC
jgi:hypothetical protein